MIIIFGFALNPEVTGLRLGVVDLSRSAESRELVSALDESRAFTLKGYYSSSDEMGTELGKGHLDIGTVIPWDFARKRARRETADVQLLLDGVNTNTAEIAGGYAALVIRSLNASILASYPPAGATASQPSVASNSSQTAPAAPAASAPAPMPGGVTVPGAPSVGGTVATGSGSSDGTQTS